MKNGIPLVLVEDESLFRELLQRSLSLTTGVRVMGAYPNGDALLTAEVTYMVAIIDIELGQGPNGIQTGLLLRRTRPNVGIVILSQHDPEEWLSLIPTADRRGWTYLRKSEVRDTRAILQAIQAVLRGEDLLGDTPPPRVQGPVASLTARQLEILRLIALGYSNHEIGEQLRLAPKSVEHAINRVYRSLHIATDASWLHPRVEAARQYWDAVRSRKASEAQR